MKTRIISGIIMGAIVVGVLLLGIYVSPLFITAFVALLAAGGTYELVHNAAGVKSKAANIGACVFAFLNVVFRDANFKTTLYMHSGGPALGDTEIDVLLSSYKSIKSISFSEVIVPLISVLFFLFAVVVILKNHKDMDLGRIAVFCAMPIALSFAFSTLGSIISMPSGIYYLLMLFNFSSICDMGAYFVGVTCGKHKLCPEISPKKTIEGAVGGIVSSLVFALVFVFAFGHADKLLTTMIFTIPLCVVGMLGDLFASSIKRSVGLKDYGKLIPGHGGVLDRVDSILMLAPIVYLLIRLGVL